MPASSKSAVRFTERAELLDFLLEVSAATSETLDLDKLMANLAEIVQQVIPYQLLAILLYNERAQGLRIRYAIGHRDEVVKNLFVQLGEGITGAAAESRQAILVPDVQADPRYLSGLDAVRSELAVPMLARGKLVGVIDVQATRTEAFTEYERALLRLIASRAAAAIDNARLYRRVDRQNRMLRTLAAISQEFSSILDLDELLGKIAETMRSLINYDAFSILLVDEAAQVLRHRFSLRYNELVQPDNIPLGKGITGTAAATRQPLRVDDTAKDSRYIAAHPAIRSEVAIPLMVHDHVVGVMDLESGRIAYFTENHVQLLMLLAPQIASFVENARLHSDISQRERRMQDDLIAARKVQSILLPRRAPAIEGLEIGIGLHPAREISGDLYDFFEYSSDEAVIVFGDSSGKGAAAALYGSLVSGLLRILAPRGKGPSRLMHSLNETLLERKIDAQYVTLLVMLWQAPTRSLTMANAGALPPLVCRRGELIKPRVEGVPLGLLGDQTYEELHFQAEPGDVIVLYSDGITDALNADGEEYGRRRLGSVVVSHCASAANEIVDTVLADVDSFTAGAAAFDDQTLIIIKVQ